MGKCVSLLVNFINNNYLYTSGPCATSITEKGLIDTYCNFETFDTVFVLYVGNHSK